MKKIQVFRILALFTFASGQGDQSMWSLFKMAKQINVYMLLRKREKSVIEKSSVCWTTHEYTGTDGS